MRNFGNRAEITVAKSAGFCFGVKRAIAMTEELAEKCKGEIGETAETDGIKKVCTLGQLIHNNDVAERLEKKGIIVVDSPSECPRDNMLVIRSHGVPLSVYDEINALGLKYVDATCPFVAKIHGIVADASASGADVIIAGDPDHPEVTGIAGHVNNGKNCYIISNSEELEALFVEGSTLNVKIRGKDYSNFALIMVAQTTFNRAKWRELQEIAKKHCTKVQIFDTICSATTNRQLEAEQLAKKSDLMIVLGGFHSSNSRKLADICGRYTKTVFAENKDGLPLLDITELSKAKRLEGEGFKIGITAGASTPADIIKEVHIIMSETTQNDELDIDFMAEVDKTFKRVYIGNRVKALVVAVNKTEAVVDIGTKHSGYISADELSNNPNLLPSDIVKVGDTIDCVVTSINDAEGIVFLSKKRVDAALGIEKIAKANEEGTTLDGVVTAVVKGGVIVSCEGARVFIPASQTGVPKTGKLEELQKKNVKFKVIEINEARGRVVGSIKAANKEENDAIKAKFWSEIEVGKKFTGEVKSMESYGVFVDLGGVDGMVHLSELTWNRIKHPKEVVSIGDKLNVYVKSFDLEKKRVSLGAKDPNDNPWVKFVNEFHEGDVVKVQIVSITPFGAFAQIIPGVDGLIHISQISLERVTNVAQVLSVGQVVDAKITEIDQEKSRVSLSMKALLEDNEEEPADAE